MPRGRRAARTIRVNGRAGSHAAGSARPAGSTASCQGAPGLGASTPSMCMGVRLPDVTHRPRPFQPAFGSLMPAIHALREEAHGIRHAELNDLPVRERIERVGVVARPDWSVRPEPQRVVLDHPRRSTALPRRCPSRERGARDRVERPALGAAVAVIGARPIERAPALLAVEACDAAARQRHPTNARLRSYRDPHRSISGVGASRLIADGMEVARRRP